MKPQPHSPTDLPNRLRFSLRKSKLFRALVHSFVAHENFVAILIPRVISPQTLDGKRLGPVEARAIVLWKESRLPITMSALPNRTAFVPNPIDKIEVVEK
ncbi:hypothetical protein ACFFQF_11310 [Haladaptatus pallidirubidus]|uniref:Uncharacterized protein n=1 Tax=Haladaptatus pallidirubidus TaxID=1008152 RepID=A0AAV3UE23_9EURY|nr:hypothetical protein [Haladaptatus pallidirubidus]